MKTALILSLLPLGLAGCGGNDTENVSAASTDNGIVASPAASSNSLSPPVSPPPGQRDARTPTAEAPFTPDSPQGAANVVQSYYKLIEQGRYRDAWALWSDGGKASGMSEEAFAASFGKFGEYHAEVGAPGTPEGAAGSVYITVPVRLYGRLKSGEAFNMEGPVTLRRVNDVPGSTEEQRRWHIAEIGVKPRP